MLSSGSVRLLDLPELLREARTLERRRGPAKDTVDHVRGSHDDAINAAAGALTMAAAAESEGRGLTWGEPGRFVGVGPGSPRRHRPMKPSKHNPKVAQDLVDFAEGRTHPRDRGPAGDALRRQQARQQSDEHRLGPVPDRIAAGPGPIAPSPTITPSPGPTADPFGDDPFSQKNRYR
jgi:hypothetical protein